MEGVGFRDLIELLFIQTFAATGIPLKLISHTIEELREHLGRQYPLTSATFRTDGRRIFMELLDESGDVSLVDVVARQDVMRRIIDPSLRKGQELGIDDQAKRWFPLKGSRAVILDPERSFGHPILTDVGIPTAIIAEAFVSNGSNARGLARMYEILVSAVNAALSIERRLST